MQDQLSVLNDFEFVKPKYLKKSYWKGSGSYQKSFKLIKKFIANQSDQIPDLSDTRDELIMTKAFCFVYDQYFQNHIRCWDQDEECMEWLKEDYNTVEKLYTSIIDGSGTPIKRSLTIKNEPKYLERTMDEILVWLREGSSFSFQYFPETSNQETSEEEIVKKRKRE